MDTFKDQDNKVLKELCAKHSCEVVIAPRNLAKKFQPFDSSVNKATKSFISEKYNTWMTNEVSNQLTRGRSLWDVKIAPQLRIITPLHAK